MPIASHHSKIRLFLLANLLLCPNAFPQQNALKVPATKPAVGTHWIVTYEKKEMKSPDTPPPEKIPKAYRKHTDEAVERKPIKGEKSIRSEEYRVTAEAACVTKKYADDSERVIYIVHGVAYQMDAATQSVMVIATDGTEDSEIIFAEHYPGCDWLQARYYVNTEQQGEHRCLHFRKPATSKQTTGSDLQAYNAFLTSLEREAWIDAETGLPVSFHQGTLYGTYQHESTLTEPISLPEEITHAIKRYNGES